MHRKETVAVEGSPMEILVFEPEGAGPHPGIVVAQHLPIAHAGLEKDPFTLDVGARLAKAGFACTIPWVFHWWAPETDHQIKRDEFRDDRCVADMQAGYDLLAGLASVDADRIGVMGHCWGGRSSWLAACHNPRYRALATLYGGRIKLGMGPGAVPPVDLAANIPCPVLGLFGNDDQNPSPADVDDLDAALNAAGVPHEFHRYDGAGHAFQDFVNPDRYRKAQAEDAWEKVIAFLRSELA
ncbi:MAG: dienelactone hydrolase family protein [Rhodospirillaceae bacterium]